MDSEDITLTRPTRTGYDFKGWSFDEGISLDVTIPKGSTGNREYTALWELVTYTLSSDLDGGTVSQDNPVSYDIESSDITLVNPTRSAYTFTGWTGTDLSANTMSVTIPADSSGDRTYTANFTIIIYTLSYDLNGGTIVTANPTSYDVESSDITLVNPTKNAYSFTGWTGTGLSGNTVNVTIPKGSVGNRSYTANFGPVVYTITYNLNGGTNGAANPTSYTVDSATLTLTAATKAGCTFDGWTLNGSPVTAISAGSTGNRVLTANFTPITYTITYELDGGTNDESNPSSYNIESATITLKDPTKEGSDFAGWTLDGAAITEIPTGSSGDKTITANWGNIAPVMSSGTYSLTAYKGQYSRLAMSATGLNLKWSLDGALPSGMAFSGAGNTAEISGTPEFGTSGTYSVRVVAANDGGAASADVVITVTSDFAQSGDVETTDPETVTTESGASRTSTATTFKNGAGNIILTADIAITTEAEELTATAVEAFSTTVTVDVTLDVHDTDCDEYAYSMEILDLPEWLSAEGEMTSTGELEDTYHHEFTLSGTPLTSRDAEKVTFVANVILPVMSLRLMRMAARKFL